MVSSYFLPGEVNFRVMSLLAPAATVPEQVMLSPTSGNDSEVQPAPRPSLTPIGTWTVISYGVDDCPLLRTVTVIVAPYLVPAAGVKARSVLLTCRSLIFGFRVNSDGPPLWAN